MNCPKCNGQMHTQNTRQNVLIEKCDGCRGIWLDKDEINFFIKNRKQLDQFETNGLVDSKESTYTCPSCQTPNMLTGQFPQSEVHIEQCKSCEGLYLDFGEITKLIRNFVRKEKESRSITNFKVNRRKPNLVTLPSLKFASFVVLGTLYSILFGVMVFLTESGYLQQNLGLLILIAIPIIQFLIGPWITDLSLRFLGSLEWIEINDLPEHTEEFLARLCKEKNIPVPKLGIIDDSAPNAFTYGRTPRSARLVLTKGIIEVLEPDELDAVVAHEVGHIYHWDFVFMTIAQMVPIALYHLYRMARRLSRSSGRGKEQGQAKAAAFTAAMVAYIAYVVCEYIVLYLSRIREYWADRFSAYATNKPNALSSALIKIAYGLVANQETLNSVEKEEKKSERMDKLKGVQAFGISNIEQGQRYNFYAAQRIATGSGEAAQEEISKEAMKWDMWNPWAMISELGSTHPLTAKRINALANQALVMRQEPKYLFDLKQPESYWDEFFIDLIFMWAPVLGFIAPWIHFYINTTEAELSLPPQNFALSLILAGALGFIANSFKYNTTNQRSFRICSLLKKVKVSAIRGVPVKLKGKVIGKGIPGYMFSEDLVLQDKSGIIFLDYQQPLALLNFLFSIFRTKKYIGREVTVEGWYRRSPVPYIEVHYLKSKSTTSRCYTPIVSRALWLLVLALGLAIKFNVGGILH